MELANRQVLVIQVVLGIVAWGAIALAVWPRIAELPRRRALRSLVAPQMFRFIGMSLLATGVAGPGLPDDFASAVATGDLATSLLSIAAFVVLGRSEKVGVPLVWIATVVGAADLLRNLVMGARSGAAEHLAAGWLVVALVVPGMLVAHLSTVRRLLQPR